MGIEDLIEFQKNRKQFSGSGELFDSLKSDVSLKYTLENLSKKYLNQTLGGCINCYMDAYIKLMNMNEEKASVAIESKLKLKNGALLRGVVVSDNSIHLDKKILEKGEELPIISRANSTEEAILAHVKNRPEFEKYIDATTLPNLSDLMENYESELESIIGSNSEKSSNALLKSLSVSDSEIESAFDKNTFEYVVTYGKLPASLPVISAETEDENAKISIGEVKKIPGLVEVFVLTQDVISSRKYTVSFVIDESLKDESDGKFTDEELDLIAKIKTDLLAGETKTNIKAKYLSTIENVGDKKLTGVLLDNLLKSAQLELK